MARSRQSRWLIVLGIGMAGGLILGGLWPHTPLYAVASDRVDTFAMATGPLDNDVEAVYFLDFLTGDLTAVVLGKQPNTWTGYFHTNVSDDLAVDSQRNPKFMMVTGVVSLRRGGGSRQQPSSRDVLRGRSHQRPSRGLRGALVALDVCRRTVAERAAGEGRRHPLPPSRGRGPRPGSRSCATRRAKRQTERPIDVGCHANHRERPIPSSRRRLDHRRPIGRIAAGR